MGPLTPFTLISNERELRQAAQGLLQDAHIETIRHTLSRNIKQGDLFVREVVALTKRIPHPTQETGKKTFEKGFQALKKKHQIATLYKNPCARLIHALFSSCHRPHHNNRPIDPDFNLDDYLEHIFLMPDEYKLRKPGHQKQRLARHKNSDIQINQSMLLPHEAKSYLSEYKAQLDKIEELFNQKTEHPLESKNLPSPYLAAVTHFQGKRASQEDQHAYGTVMIDKKECPYFALFDGHGGGDGSLFSKKVLNDVMKDLFSTKLPSMQPERNTEIEYRLTILGLKIQDRLLGELAEGTELQGGTTMVCTIPIDGFLWTANIGDSRAILQKKVYNTSEALPPPVQLTVDAKANLENPNTFSRSVQRRFGEIRPGQDGFARVGGSLAVCRAIGDFDIPGISARAKVTKERIPPQGAHVLLACDGVWDTISTKQAGALMTVCQNVGDLTTLTEMVIKAAFTSGSEDNISALVFRIPPYAI